LAFLFPGINDDAWSNSHEQYLESVGNTSLLEPSGLRLYFTQD